MYCSLLASTIAKSICRHPYDKHICTLIKGICMVIIILLLNFLWWSVSLFIHE